MSSYQQPALCMDLNSWSGVWLERAAGRRRGGARRPPERRNRRRRLRIFSDLSSQLFILALKDGLRGLMAFESEV